MENVILVIHLILALCLIAVVLLQRSEGGGLGMGGGGGGAAGGLVSGRAAASALSKLTWLFAVAFICTSITLTIIAAKNSAGGSVLDRLGADAPASSSEGAGDLLGDDLLPPSAGDEPLVPPRAD
ncbi:preprotein translocase subunit SecG [Actibacterium mucosum KCTC 23349]|uniref:Protein-export membrane protein SecG n=1 Tax=Actibacterium mucosum KCTC 23349 TaxID=1454373 RepID=A0A037ZH77_9RHOB|nr:preprotein translocase subunit SecG [Actibacterium mucosum]KAJ54175.1 preprotein translocase subunit SecG [Actibacterium mucosum KCTC 23349]